MIVSVHQPQYLPWLGYFAKIQQSDSFVFLDRVQYKAREYQNRNKIRAKTKDGWMWLTVPVISKGLRGQLIFDARIDNDFNWQREHYKSLQVCYAKANFSKEYTPFLKEIYTQKKWDKLADLNLYIIKYLIKELGIKTQLYYESQLGTTQTGTERIIEICRKLKADTYLSGLGGKEYLEEEKFNTKKIKLVYQDFRHPQYKQCYEPFIPFMSLVDLLFNHGKEAVNKIL